MTNNAHVWQAEKYSQNSQYQCRTFMKLIKNHSFIGDESILDVGCGDGKISAKLADLVPEGKVMAVDNSTAMLQFAQQNHQRSNLIFKHCDAENLSSLNKYFDMVVSSFCLHWVEDKKKAFNEIAACLKSGGKLMMVMTHRNPIMAKVRDEMVKGVLWEKYFVDFVDASMRIEDSAYDGYATAAGLKIDEYYTESVRVDFASSQALKDFFSNLTPHLSRLPDEDLKEKFMDQLIEEYLKLVPSAADGLCHMIFTCVNLVGEKTFV